MKDEPVQLIPHMAASCRGTEIPTALVMKPTQIHDKNLSHIPIEASQHYLKSTVLILMSNLMMENKNIIASNHHLQFCSNQLDYF